MGVAEKLAQLKAAKSAANLEEGRVFLEENSKREGVICLPSGLQYEVIKEGDGIKPTIDSRVICHYQGTLINGSIFDSSIQRGQPTTFQLKKVIRGWTEALQMMPIGSKWRLFIPANLAYGDQHISAAIGPNTTLIFDVELIGIE